jgi:cold shock CspA family protein/ribosome-associated translation inhibitor RaiA
MQLPPTVTFRGIRPTEGLEAEVLEHARKLETYFQPIMACRVLVEWSERHHAAGNRYHVRIDLTVPGEEIVIRHDASQRARARALGLRKLPRVEEPEPGHKYARAAIREAFHAARRRLLDYARRRRGAVKLHTTAPRGRVLRILPDQAYGFIEAPDGHEVYFQRSAVLRNAFDRLRVGSEVTFVEEAGDKGPQASTVRLAARRSAAPRMGRRARA